MLKTRRMGAVIVPIMMASLLVSPASASTVDDRVSSTSVNSVADTEKILAIGSDGLARTVETVNAEHHKEYELRNRLNLQPGDSVQISEDRNSAIVLDQNGSELGTFLAPTVIVDGREVPAHFAFSNGYLSTSVDSDSVPLSRKKGCGRGTAAKWIWRGAGALTCTAAGVATIVGGAACGLAWSGAEDAMNIDGRSCK
jgi:hypothetical protein